MGSAHIVIHPDLEPIIEKVAKIITASECENGFLMMISTDMLPDGYHGVMNAVIRDGVVIRFERDMDT